MAVRCIGTHGWAIRGQKIEIEKGFLTSFTSEVGKWSWVISTGNIVTLLKPIGVTTVTQVCRYIYLTQASKTEIELH